VVILNQAQVNARFQQMRGVTVAQGVHMGALGDSGTLHLSLR
jgi:hypothetical protein